jgi:hypothetical protein
MVTTFYIGNTDYHWFSYLKSINPEDVNFWQPGGNLRFRAILEGAPFLLWLKSPVNKIAGIGFFSSHSLLPVDFAWEVFQERNGARTYEEFYSKIDSYRRKENRLNIISPDYHIEVSQRIKEQFENGRDYYKFHGNQMVTLPSLSHQKPNIEFIDWHNSNIYKG